jgi:hypothetical protein
MIYGGNVGDKDSEVISLVENININREHSGSS